MSGDGIAASAARKIHENMDRIRDNHQAHKRPARKIVLTEKEKLAMGISNDRFAEKSRFKHAQLLWLLFGAVVLFCTVAQCVQVRGL